MPPQKRKPYPAAKRQRDRVCLIGYGFIRAAFRAPAAPETKKNTGCLRASCRPPAGLSHGGCSVPPARCQEPPFEPLPPLKPKKHRMPAGILPPSGGALPRRLQRATGTLPGAAFRSPATPETKKTQDACGHSAAHGRGSPTAVAACHRHAARSRLSSPCHP